MLLVPVRVGQSSIHGLGAFAVERILKGTAAQRQRSDFAIDRYGGDVAVRDIVPGEEIALTMSSLKDSGPRNHQGDA